MKKVIKFLPLVAAILGVISLIALFLPAIVLDNAENDKFPGIATIIGYDKKTPIGKVPMLGFSFMNLLTYILVVVGIVCAILAFLKKGGIILPCVGVVCLLVAGIFFFCVMSFATLEYEPLKLIWSRGYGATMAGVCSIIGACSLAANVVLEKVLNK